MLVPKGLLRLERVGRNTQNRGLALRKRGRQSCEVDGLLRAARGVRAWVEKQHEFSSRIVGERDGFAAIARKAKGGRFGALGQVEFASGGRVSFSAGRFCRGRRFSRRLRWGAGRLPGGGLGGFLARFLGHTPSFRRFRRINHWGCGPCLGEPESGRLLGKPDGLGVWLQGIRRTTRPLVECVAWALMTSNS